MVEDKHDEDANDEGKREGRGDAAVQTGLRVRPGDQDEAEQVPFRRRTTPAMREHHAKEAGLKVLKTRG